MKSISELTDFYYNNLYADLEQLEADRKKLASKLITIFITIAVIVVIAILFYGKIDELSAFMLFGGIAIGGFIYSFSIKGYASDFKVKIIAPLIHAIDTNLDYHPSQHVSQREFERSYLFKDRIDRYSGNDLVSGSVDSVAIKFSDIHAQKVTRDSKGREHRSTIFKGLFLVAEFNKSLHSKTIVLPDQAEKLFGSLLGSWLQANNFTQEDLVKMDNSEFEKNFVVYGSDQIESRYILTHSMMQRVLDYKKKVGKNISLSFIDEKLYIAIHYNEDLFEPTVFTSLLKMEVMLNYVKGLQLAISIVEELKLNERLWSKT